MSERDYDRLIERYDEVNQLVLRGLYRHYKHGDIYQLKDVCFDKETEEAEVLYTDWRYPNIIWRTSLEDWTSKVETQDGTTPRYTWLPGEGL